jgi:hypothetical protein
MGICNLPSIKKAGICNHYFLRNKSVTHVNDEINLYFWVLNIFFVNFEGRKKESRVKKAKKYPTNEAVNDENPYFELVMTKSYVHGSFMVSLL